MPVTPKSASHVVIVTGGTAVVVFPPNPAGGFITNPASAADQGLGAAEDLYINPITAPGSTPGVGNGTTFVLAPGQTWTVIAGQTTYTRANAASSGHKFSAVYWV